MKHIALRMAAAWLCARSSLAFAQSSSLLRWPEQRGGARAGAPDAEGAYAPAPAPFAAVGPRDKSRPSTHALEMASLVAVPPVAPRKFKINDLITIIVRQQKKYEANGQLNNEDKWNIDGKLSDWFHLYDKKYLGTDNLTHGQPGFKFDLDNKLQQQSVNDRQDSFTTRFGATVIDVKPNGNLVLEAKMSEQHDEEKLNITLTGICRSEDVTADNSILSTQVAELVLIEKNQGAVRDATKRGWIPRLLDWGKPF